MSILSHDLKYTWRSLRRAPGLALVLVLTLAVGIGINSAMFSIVSAALLRPLPFPEPGRLVAVWEGRKGGANHSRVTGPDFVDLERQTASFSAVAAFGGGPDVVAGGETPMQVPIYGVTRDFFTVLGVEPALGRGFSAEEAKLDGPLGVVVSHAFWRASLGGDPAVLGRRLAVSGREGTVIGVMPPGFAFPKEAALWLPAEHFGLGESRTAHNFQVVARLAPGADLAAARAETELLAARLAAAYPVEMSKDFALSVAPLHQDLVGKARASLLLLLTVVAVVLLIACGNVASLLLSQAVARGKELAVRRALGAGRARLMGQMLTESMAIGLAGAGAGLLLCAGSLGLVNAVVPAGFLPSGAVRLDWRVVAFTLAVGLASGLLFGLAPALRAARHDPMGELRGDGSTVAAGGRRRRLGGLFVVPQYAFSLAALIVAGLVLESLSALGRVDPGFAVQGRVAAEITLPTSPPSPYAQPAKLVAYYREVAERAAALSGVRSVSFDASLPLSGDRLNGAAFAEGDEITFSDDFKYYPDYRVVGADYFRTLGTPLVAGRDFTLADGPEAPPVAIVNRALARQMWGEANPLGKKLMVPGLDWTREEALRWLTVVGVAADVHHAGLDADPRPAAYVPYPQHLARASEMALVAAVEGRPESFAGKLRDILRSEDPALPLGRVEPLAAWVHDSTAQPRFRAGLLSGFGGLALLLALLGVYGVTSYSLSRRRREIAVRYALGARQGDVLRMLAGEGLRFVVAGQIAGTAVALALGRLLHGLLFEVSATDPRIFLVVSPLFALVVLWICYLPASRAGRVDPALSLRG